MQIFKMLINSLPYKFQNVVFIGDFPKSTIHAATTLNADQKVLCNLNSALEVDGIAQQPFPVLDSFTNLQNYQNANLKGFSSLKAPAGIKQLLPGIIFDQAPLQCQPLDNLLQNLNIPEGSANLTVLNLNGAEYEYLVENEILLNTFSCALISCSSRDIFEGAEENYEKLLAHLEAKNIAYSVFPAEVHPFSFILIHRMPNWKAKDEAMAAISQEHEQLQNSLIEAQQNSDMLSQKSEQAESALAARDKELQVKASEVAELSEKAEANIDALKSEQERSQQLENQTIEQRSNIDALTNEKQELQASNNDLNAKCEKLEQDKQRIEQELGKAKVQVEEQNQKLQNKIKEQQVAIDSLTNEKQAHEASLSDLKAKYEKLEHYKGWLEEELRKTKAQVLEEHQSVNIANKLNLKLQADLDDLRQKYTEKEQNERELSQLIDELYVKLKQASEFYYELEKKYPELTDEQRD